LVFEKAKKNKVHIYKKKMCHTGSWMNAENYLNTSPQMLNKSGTDIKPATANRV